MQDVNPAGGGKINWPLAVVASVALHVVGIGLVLFFAGAFDSGGSASATQPAGGPSLDPVESEVEQVTPVAPPASSSSASPVAPSGASSSGAAATPPLIDPAEPSGPATYKVKSGDSLSKIAKNHGCTVKELAELNGFPINKKLDVGETLKVPR